MSIQQRPVSQLIRGSDFPEDVPKKRSREDFKKEKELEELRKAGTVPALVDEDGKDINPHIPQYISITPWYYGSSGPTLKHQRPQDENKSKIARVDEWYQRGTTNKITTNYRPGACENCGAMGHNRKSCFKKPRKIPAKVSGIVTAPDDVEVAKLNLDYDGKRDRWNGYRPQMYKAVVDEYEKLEEAKKTLKEKGDSDSDSDEEDKYADHIDMPGTKVDSKQRITVRNLRIREDTAKYLRNLDPDSAYYDPKTRSMRDNPYKNTSKNSTDLPYAGENYVRHSADAVKVGQAQLFAWQARDKGVDIHLQAEPTAMEIIRREHQIQKTKHKTSIKQRILEKYGGEEYLQSPPAELVYGQSERYVEYSRDGKPKIEPPKTIISSRYEEDVHPNNHKSVWGSFYNVKTQKWGYKCCHVTMKNAYCVGSAGISY
ncbi:pre-mRNA-splicing factor SLU7-like [Panonychus citri]|uniref:pre-mRNA-splicing factor SLU7-like n=1 Tax=Panonychus citri TaxID=50023 RepID=UPI00230755C9|nr:pre-mRNA-splicing factor SLU7-like [Panonychus citri]